MVRVVFRVLPVPFRAAREDLQDVPQGWGGGGSSHPTPGISRATCSVRTEKHRDMPGMETLSRERRSGRNRAAAPGAPQEPPLTCTKAVI